MQDSTFLPPRRKRSSLFRYSRFTKGLLTGTLILVLSCFFLQKLCIQKRYLRVLEIIFPPLQIPEGVNPNDPFAFFSTLHFGHHNIYPLGEKKYLVYRRGDIAFANHGPDRYAIQLGDEEDLEFGGFRFPNASSSDLQTMNREGLQRYLGEIQIRDSAPVVAMMMPPHVRYSEMIFLLDLMLTTRMKRYVMRTAGTLERKWLADEYGCLSTAWAIFRAQNRSLAPASR